MEKDSPITILSMILITTLIIVSGTMLVLMSYSKFDNLKADPLLFECLPGQCGTNIQSGVKRCTSGTGTVFIDPSREVCNGRFVCDNLKTPYAILSDQSTNLLGVCEENTECGCTNTLKCADYIQSIFKTFNGDAYSSFDKTRIEFQQSSSFVTKSNVSSDYPPIEYDDPSNIFCKIPIGYLSRSSPGCNFINELNPTLEELKICMGLPKMCDGSLGNVCQQGTLAFITNDPKNITKENFNLHQVSCVRGESCPCGQISVYDTNLGGILCIDL
jgi:hypothetical protein